MRLKYIANALGLILMDIGLPDISGIVAIKKILETEPEQKIIMLTSHLSEQEVFNSRSKNLTSIQTTGVKGGRTYLPYAFTEQGIYMLMSVLKGDLATKQSITLIRLFKAMKDYLIENQPFLTQKNYFALVDKVEKNAQKIEAMQESMVSKADLSDIMKLFVSQIANDEILILDGKPFKADEAYQKIYKSAKSKIIVIDDYIGTKTLHHLAHSKKNVKITVISDNAAKPRLSLMEYTDFITENPGKNITFPEIRASKINLV